MGEFRKLKNCSALRAAAKRTEFSIGFDCKAGLTMRLPSQTGGQDRTVLGKTLPLVEDGYLTQKHSLVVTMSAESGFPGWLSAGLTQSALQGRGKAV